MTRLSSVRLASSLFQSSFSSRPAVAASAPGRVNLIGEHTDYNGGPVLPLALERRTAVAAGAGGRLVLVSALDGTVRGVEIEEPLRGDWTDYLVGVVRELRAIGAAPAGRPDRGGDHGPVGAGLSSSAALTVAAAKALSLLAGRRLSPAQLVEVAYRAEHEQVGVRCGRMDQTIAAHAAAGTALLFETGTGAIQRVPLPGRLWVVETGVSHQLTGGELNQRRRECEEALAAVSRAVAGAGTPGRPRDRRSPDGQRAAGAGAGGEGAARGDRDVPHPDGGGRAGAGGHGAGGMAAGAGARVAPDGLPLQHPRGGRDRGAGDGARRTRRSAHGGRLGRVRSWCWRRRIGERGSWPRSSREFRDRFGREPEVWSTRAASGVRRETVWGRGFSWGGAQGIFRRALPPGWRNW